MGIGKSLKVAALGLVMLASTGATTSSLEYRIHYLTEAGNSEPGFPYPYVGYSEYYCDGSVITYGKLTSITEYEYVYTC